MEQKKFYYVYQITNLINGKIYVGMHVSYSLDDTYMGSGKIIKQAIAKYGLENFKKTILFEGASLEEIAAKEAEIVTSEFIQRDDTYNLKEGGIGGFSPEACYLGAEALKQQTGQYGAEGRWQGWKAEGKGIFSEESRKKNREATAKRDKAYLHGRVYSEETLQKLRDAAKARSLGAKKGSHWVTNDVEDKKLPPGEPIPEGWRIGRKKKPGLK